MAAASVRRHDRNHTGELPNSTNSTSHATDVSVAITHRSINNGTGTDNRLETSARESTHMGYTHSTNSGLSMMGNHGLRLGQWPAPPDNSLLMMQMMLTAQQEAADRKMWEERQRRGVQERGTEETKKNQKRE